MVLKEAIAAILPSSRHTRLQTLCETRWVERHKAIMIFAELCPAVVHSLELIASDTSFDDEVSDKADGFKFRVRTLDFVSNLKILENVLGHTFRLSVVLQSKEVDIVSCTQLIAPAKANLDKLLVNSLKEFSKIFKCIVDILNAHDIPLISRPSRQNVNVELSNSEAAEKHLRENRYKTLLRRTVEELDEQFGATFNNVLKFFTLIPYHLITAVDVGM